MACSGCAQRTRRYVDPTGTAEHWQLTDTLLEKLTYFGHKEDYKLISVNDQLVTTPVDRRKLGGATSSGEFGSVLSQIFAPQTLTNFAWEKFGNIDHGMPRVQAISKWLHDNIEYRYMSGRPDISAWDVLQRGHGVCRDFAHLAIALNRTFNLPTRYVTGHLPDIGFPDSENHMDFHAYAEVYIGESWFTTDARFHAPRIGRIKVSCGQDAVDGAFSTIFGGATLTYFEVWAYQVPRGTVGIGDPIDLSRRLDNQWAVRTDH